MYLIPKNVGGRFEFFEGFGIKELIYCALSALVAIGLSFFIGLFTSSLFRFLPVPFIVYATFMLVRIDPRLGRSLLENMVTINTFNGKPKRYDYVYGEGRIERV
ncbi:hypothetical protein [Paenibacillus sp. FSL L8-0463]|uniref:hypothetical protein n=1 Tax=Paenibacillus sp. FSL L8-0463 TaxID=2954687 RepID=UPI0031193B5C